MKYQFSIVLLLSVVLLAFSSVQARDTHVLRTPALDALQQRMDTRLKELEGYNQGGAIGLSAQGYLVIRDLDKLPLDIRSRVKLLLAKENRDREVMLQALDLMIPKLTKTELRIRQMPEWLNMMPDGSWFEVKGAWRQKS